MKTALEGLISSVDVDIRNEAYLRSRGLQVVSSQPAHHRVRHERGQYRCGWREARTFYEPAFETPENTGH
ncbi:MAG: hypothetical protein LBD58_01325 [Treponema sp.]|nr:hypothetical protein [Treponema sp.]